MSGVLEPHRASERMCRVEDLRPGDRLVLPGGVRVEVQRLDDYADGLLTVRWQRAAQHGEPGHLSRDRAANDGLYLGSLIPVPAEHEWRIEA